MLDFPASPTNGQTYTGPNGVIWVWDTQKWVNGTQIGTAYAPIKDPIFTGNPTAPTPPAGDADTSLATTQFVAAATGTALNNVGRNLLHNPLMAISQRGTTSFSTAGYTLDRWRLDFSLDTSLVQQIDNDDAHRTQIGDEAASKLMLVNVTGNAGASAFTVVSQYMEDVRRLAGKTVTVSFWAYATAGTPKLGVAASQRFGTGGSPSAQVDINGTPVTLSTVATRYTVTFTYPSIIGKTLGTNGDSSNRLALFFSSGATNNTFAGGIGVQAANFILWGVQLEVGSVATPLEKPDPQQDLAKCCRFYQTGDVYLSAYSAAGSQAQLSIPLVVQMQHTPTTSVNPVFAGNCSAFTLNGLNNRTVVFNTTVTTAAYFQAQANWTASADL